MDKFVVFKIIKSFLKKLTENFFINMLAYMTWLKWQMYYVMCPMPHVLYVMTNILIDMIIEYLFDMIKMNYVLIVMALLKFENNL
jgi:hypothetical protein